MIILNFKPQGVNLIGRTGNRANSYRGRAGISFRRVKKIKRENKCIGGIFYGIQKKYGYKVYGEFRAFRKAAYGG
jgi:hypothetical protein